MALDNLARILRLNQIFKPNIPIESGYPGGTVTMKPNADIGINDDWSWIHGDVRPKSPLYDKSNIRMDTLSQPIPQQPDQSSISDILGSLYHPETTYSDMYSKALGEMPQRTKPGLKNRIAAGLVGLSGDQKAAENIKYRDYNEKLADWETKMKFLQPGMQYERYANTNERANAYQTASAILRERQLAQQAEKDRIAAEQRDYANQIRAQVARGGQVVTDDKTKQAYMVYKDGSKVPLDIGKLSPLDLEELRQTNRVNLEDERQSNRVDLENMREASAREIANLRSDITMELTRQRYELMGQRDLEKFGTPVQAYSKDGKPLDYLVSVNGKGEVRKIQLDQDTAIKPPPGAGKTGSVQSESQKAQGVSNRALQIKSEHPEWSRYIKTDPKTGKFTGITTPGLFLGPNQDMYNKIYEAVYQEPFTAQSAGALRDNPTVKQKVGDIKTFPNGKKGRWDGKGWALIEEGATK